MSVTPSQSEKSPLPAIAATPTESRESFGPTPPPDSAFSPRQRIAIITIACFTGFLSPLSSLLYTPALPTIASDLDVSISKVNLTITTYLIFQGVTPSLWGTLGDAYGRRLLYIVTSTISTGACIGLSMTNSYGVVLGLRALQATGCASTTALGAGVIRDLVPSNKRGGVMGLYSAGIGVGTALGPFLGGVLAQYVGWHGIFYFLLGLSSFCFLLVSIFLPETLHGIVGNGSVSPPKYLRPPIRWLCPHHPPLDSASEATNPRFDDDVKNQKRPNVSFLDTLKLLTHLEALSCVLVTGVFYTVWQNSMVATSTLYADEYHLTQLQIGLTYISNGVGALVGNLVTGRILDNDYTNQLRREKNEATDAADRKVAMIERARLFSLRYFAPAFAASIIVFGWVIQSKTHIAVSIIVSFFIGWFDSSILTTYSTLMVDLYEEKASAATAIINLVRCLLGAVGSSTIEPMIKALGVGWAFTTLGGICVIFLTVIWLQYLHGYNLRSRRRAL